MSTLTLTINRPRRQALATIALVALTIVPTFYVAVLAWRINRPAHVHEIEKELTRQLGLKVSIDAVRHPRPGEDVLTGVVLRSEDHRAGSIHELLRAERVRLVRGSRDLLLDVEGLRLWAESPRQAMGQVAAMLQKAGESAYTKISLSAPNCRIDLGGEALRYLLRDVVGTFQADRPDPAVLISYRVPDEQGSATTRCELSLGRTRQGSSVRTTLVFKTMEGLPLPARVLEPFFASADWLGRSARVEGSLSLSQQGAAEWSARFQGSLTDVDLSALVGRRFPDHRLTGLARVEIAKAAWGERPGGQGFGWVNAEGELFCGPGTIGASLLRALRSEMKFGLDRMLEAREGDIPFQSLGLTFTMAPDGELRLGGGLGTEFPPGAVMVDAHPLAPMASAPEGAASVRGLIRTLFPTPIADASVLVPDTAESRILRYLPAPVATARRSGMTGN